MHKIYILSIVTVLMLLISGCTTQNFDLGTNNQDNNDETTGDYGLASVVQLTDFSDQLDRKYVSISDNGDKIIYVRYPDDSAWTTVNGVDFRNYWSLWVVDTRNPLNPTKIFDGFVVSGGVPYGFYASTGGTPVLSNDGETAYFGVVKYEDYIGYYWLPDTNPTYLAKIDIDDKSFQPIDLITYGGYDQTRLRSFRVTSNYIYCLVSFYDLAGNDANTRGSGFLRMSLSGTGQEILWAVTDSSSDTYPIAGNFYVDEGTSRLYYTSANVDYYYYLNLATNTPVKVDNEELDDYSLLGVSGYKFVMSQGYYIYVYDLNQETFTYMGDKSTGGGILRSITDDKIFVNDGNGDFCYYDYEGNMVDLIDFFEDVNKEHSGKYKWDIQFNPTNGKIVNSAGTKVVVRAMDGDGYEPNYYLLTLSAGSSTSNGDDGDGGSNTVTLIHSLQMFDFSTGQYVSESWTTEDIDVIVITDEGKARLYAHSSAEIKEQGDAEYSSYIDVSAGAICILKDNEGGIATFTVDSIGLTTEGYPTATITWSYS